MALHFDGATARLTGICSPEEAEDLLDWAREQEAPQVDLSGCAHLHAAVLQVLMAGRIAVAVEPRDGFLASAVAALPRGAP